MEITYDIKSISDTKKIAIILSKYLHGITILLSGDLGSGKTTFASFFINALSKKKQLVSSPTFPIIQSYETKIGIVYHLDLYRIENENELINLDIDEILLHTCLIEWSDNLGNYIPKDFVKIIILNKAKDERKMMINFSKKYEDIFKKIQQNGINNAL